MCGGVREKEKSQYLYSHSVWINQLLEKVFAKESDIIEICRLSPYNKKGEKIVFSEQMKQERGEVGNIKEMGRYTTSV